MAEFQFKFEFQFEISVRRTRCRAFSVGAACTDGDQAALDARRVHGAVARRIDRGGQCAVGCNAAAAGINTATRYGYRDRRCRAARRRRVRVCAVRAYVVPARAAGERVLRQRVRAVRVVRVLGEYAAVA